MINSPIPDFAPIKCGRLSKNILYEIEEGLFLVSNIGISPLQPVLAEKVVSSSKKEYQWAKIKEVGANGRLCRVFKSKEDFVKYFNKPIVNLLIE